MGDEVKILGVADGRVVVAERGVEDSSAVVVVGPDDDGGFGLLRQFLGAAGEGLGRLVDLDVVVKLLVAGLPVDRLKAPSPARCNPLWEYPVRTSIEVVRDTNCESIECGRWIDRFHFR